MKNKLQSILVLLFLLTTTITMAQAQTEIRVKAGAHYSNIIFEDANGDKQDTQFAPGWHIGLSVDVPVGGEFYIQPALLYTRKGFTQEDGTFGGSGNNLKVKANYVDLSINFLYKPGLGSGKLVFGAGPYMAYGLGGKWEADEDVVIGDVIIGDHGDINFSNDALDGGGGNSYLYGKPLDYGASFLVGYEFFNKISAQFNVRLGMANLLPDYSVGTQQDGSLKNIGFGISLGYKL